VNSFKQFLDMHVTIANRTGKRLYLSHLVFDGLTSGRAADGVHDPGTLGPSAPTSLAAGRTATFRIAFGVKQLEGFELRVSLSPARNAVVFAD